MLTRIGSPPPEAQITTGMRPEGSTPQLIETPNQEQNAYDVFRAANLKYNPLAAVVDSFIDNAGPSFPSTGVYDGLSDIPLPFEEYSPYDEGREAEIEGYPADLFVESRSPLQTRMLKHEYDKDERNDQILSQGGAYGLVNSVAAGVFNPLALVPLFGFTNAASRASIGFLKAAGTAGAAETLSEVVLHKYDHTRTLDESAINIVGASAFSGLIGGLVGRAGDDVLDDLLKAEAAFLEENRQINSVLSDPTLEAMPLPGKPGVFELVESRDISKLPGVDRLGTANRKLAWLTPIRGLGSRNPLMRRMTALLGEQTVVGSQRASIETLIKRKDGDLAKAITTSRRSWKASNADQQVDNLTYREFQGAVAHALRNGDVHVNPHVQAATKGYRKILQDIKKDAVTYGLLAKEDTLTKFAQTYFTRMYNMGKIRSESGAFTKHIAEYLQEQNPKLSMEEAHEVAIGIHRQITNNDYQAGFHKSHVPQAGPLKGRTLAIPDNVLSPYLINEPEAVIRHYVRHVGARTELAKRFGSDDLEAQISAVDDHWAKIINEASIAGGDGASAAKRMKKLSRARERDRVDLEAMRDRILNRYKMPDDPSSGFVRGARGIRNLNTLRLLGGMTLSAFPDMARPIYQHGLRAYAKGIIKVVSNSNLRKMNNAELKRMGVALDTVLSQRLQSIADLDYNPYGVSKFERRLEDMAQGTGYGGNTPDFGKVSLMSYWNSSMKQFSGLLSQDGLLAKVATPGKYAKDLSRGGIAPEMAKRIHGQYKKFGTTEGGMRLGNSDKWTDADAALAYEAAIIKEVDGTIITPGILDRPLWMSSEGGKVVGQMRSFVFASTNKQLMAGIAQGDRRVVQGVLASTVFGALSLTVKGILAGKTAEEITGDNPAEFIWKSVVHSGAIGVVSELADLQMSLSGSNGSTYMYEKNALGTVFGPTMGLVEDAAKATTGDVTAARRLIPYNNLFYVRKLFDLMEEGVEGAVE